MINNISCAIYIVFNSYTISFMQFLVFCLSTFAFPNYFPFCSSLCYESIVVLEITKNEEDVVIPY